MAETWILNEVLNPSINTIVDFTANNISYTSLCCDYNDDPLEPTAYLAYGIPGDTNYKQVYLGGWNDGTEAYRAITFPTPPTGDLLAWLQANGTKQAARKSYDLSTSAKWATLSSGNHNVQIVAKASGYRDSEKSAAAVVKKEYPNVTLAKGSYKFFTNMTLPSTTWQVEMPFTSNNVSYSQLQVYGTDQIVLNRGIWYNTNHACVGAEWDDDTYQIITLSADAQVPSDFLTWFNANTSPCIEAGTYQFAEIIRIFPSNQTIDFTSNGNSYSQFTFHSLGMDYAKASSTLVYVKSTETWGNQAFRIVTFATTQVCSSTFFTWFKMYASVYTATISAGMYKFLDTVSFPSMEVSATFNFTSEDLNLTSIRATTSLIYYGAGSAEVEVYDATEKWAKHDTSDQIITLTEDATVSYEFSTWFAANANRVGKISSGTYKFKDTLPALSTAFDQAIKFSSNGGSYLKMMWVVEGNTPGLWYGDSFHAYNSTTASWYEDDSNNQIIAVTEDAIVTEDFVTWFNQNANAYTPTYTLEAGTYKFIDSLALPTSSFEQFVNFVSNSTTYAAMFVNTDSLQYYDSISSSPLTVYSDQGWSTSDLKTITLSTAQTVSADFYNWAITDGNLVKKESPTTYTVTISSTASLSSAVDATTGNALLTGSSYDLIDGHSYEIVSGYIDGSTYYNLVINGVTYSSNRTLNIYAENIVISTSSAGTVSSTPVTVTIKFTSTKTTGQTWLLAQSVSTSSDISADIEFYVGSTRYTTFYIEGMPGNYIAYISSSDSETVFIDNEWKKEADRTVYFPVAPTGELLTWLQANGTLQGGGVTTETWILNESLTATESFDSGNLDDDHIFQTPGYMDGTGPGFNRITFQYNDETNSYMRYRLKKAEAKVAYVKDSDGERWTSEGWRTLIFDKPVTDTDLLAWLQANGVKQGGGLI